MSKAAIEKLNIVIEAIERMVVKNVEEDAGSMSFLKRMHKDHQAVLYFRDLLTRRHAEPEQGERLCRDEAILIVNQLFIIIHSCIITNRQ